MDSRFVQRAKARAVMEVLDPLSEALVLLDGGSLGRGAFPRWQPEVHLEENDEHLVIRVALPGARPDNVRVRLAADLLTLEADRRLDEQRRNERGFVRSFLLPSAVGAEAVDAVMSEGTLTVTVDKRRRPRRRRISIH
jgi:HSP20 family protein